MLGEIAPEVKLEDLSELSAIYGKKNDDFSWSFPEDPIR